jgi:hypothetical protein
VRRHGFASAPPSEHERAEGQCGEDGQQRRLPCLDTQTQCTAPPLPVQQDCQPADSHGAAIGAGRWSDQAAILVWDPMEEWPVAERKRDRDEVFVEYTKSICPVCKVVLDAQVNIRRDKVSGGEPTIHAAFGQLTRIRREPGPRNRVPTRGSGLPCR